MDLTCFSFIEQKKLLKKKVRQRNDTLIPSAISGKFRNFFEFQTKIYLEYSTYFKL